MMKILHIAETVQGGVASYLNDMLVPLSRRYGSHNLIVAAPVDQLEELRAPKGVRVVAMPPRHRSIKNMLGFTCKAFQLIRSENPDLIHVHSSVAGLLVRPIAAFAKLSRLSLPAPLIFTPHGWSFVMQMPSWKKRLYAWTERALSLFSSKIVLVTETEKDLAVQAGFGPVAISRCHVIETGIPDLDPAQAARSAKAGSEQTPSPEHWQTDENSIDLIFAGRLDAQKGYDVLLKALNQVQTPRIRLHVFGTAVAEAGKPARTEQAPPSNVTLLHYGWQARENLLAFLPEADALLMPSRWEGLPIMAIESFRAGVPMVTSDIPVFRDMIDTADAGITCPTGDATALAKAIDLIDTPSWSNKGLNARRAYENRFTFERMFDQLTHLYERRRGSNQQHRHPSIPLNQPS